MVSSPVSPDDLAETVTGLLKEPAEMGRLAENGRKAAGLLTVERTTNDFLGVMDRMAERTAHMKDKWRILHTEASEGWGGQEIRIFTEAQGMIRRGHRVMIAAPAYAALYKKSREADIPVADVDYNRKSFSQGYPVRQETY